jgi:hypothetical protein
MSRPEQAAKRFYQLLRPGRAWDYSDDRAKPLIEAAFTLYATAWGSKYDVRRWEWPEVTLKEGGQFSGDEPWTVLLRRAVELASADSGARP